MKYFYSPWDGVHVKLCLGNAMLTAHVSVFVISWLQFFMYKIFVLFQ
jgi:hypothetical protein